jgi:ParB family chromosome partitioning protein
MALKKKGLGRGLDALLGDVKSEVGSSGDQKTLPVEQLQRGKYQPRNDIDPEKLQELANSIKAQGVIQPIVVREINADKYEIIAGERRWRAAQLAGLHEMPVVIKELDDRSVMAIALIENIQREDLNPLEESEALKRLLDEFEMTHQQIADAVGKSRATVTNLLRLLELQLDVKNMLAQGKLEMGHARALLGLEGKLQLKAAGQIVSQGLTVRATEKLVKSLQTEKTPVNKKRVDPDILRLENELTAKLGAKVILNHQQNGGGSMVISYSSLEELDGVIKRLN